MEKPNSQMDTDVMARVKSGSAEDIATQLDRLPMAASEMVQLLARYQVMSDNDNDDIFDAWYDALSQDQHLVLKAFEILRGRLEHSD